MIAGPIWPGVGELRYQPAGASAPSGGVWTVWSALRPSCMRSVCTPMAVTSSRVGVDFGSGDTDAAGLVGAALVVTGAGGGATFGLEVKKPVSATVTSRSP